MATQVAAHLIKATPEDYLDTIEKLMVAMTFSDGNAAISPRCWQRDPAGKAPSCPGADDALKCRICLQGVWLPSLANS